MELTIYKSEFIYSVPRLALMRDLSEEIVFIGRSNAGKSSLLNALCQKKDLAKTSKTPGRTRHAVVYEIAFGVDEIKKTATLVDMPGFGFASMSKMEAESCEQLIYSYLIERAQLRMIVLILDIRRSLDEREQQIIAIAKQRGIMLVLVLTKCDKIPVSKRKPIQNKHQHMLEQDNVMVLMHSTHDKKSTHALQHIIFEHN